MEDSAKIAYRVSAVTAAVNLLLSLGKLAAGILAHSGAMVSDAVHSASDVVSTIVVVIGIRLSEKDADRGHPYGHERMESVAAIVLAALLLITGLAIGNQGVQAIVSADKASLTVPGLLALAAAGASIAVKGAMFLYTRHYARIIDSEALMADGWHHLSDALSSVGALVGIAGARMGFPVLDPLASVAICLFIVKASYDIFKEAVRKLVDHSCDPETEKALRENAAAHEGVRSIDLLRTREFGNRIYVELEIGMDGTLPLAEAHDVAETIHRDIEEAFPKVKHIMVHVNPV